MILQLLKHQRKHILVDIDTQRDFLSAWGNACIMDREIVLANIRRMMAWARLEYVPIISTAEVYPNISSVNKVCYCLDGTYGQQKIPYTLLSNRVSFPADDWNALPADILLSHRQVILHKRCIDPFDEPRIERLLSEIKADEFLLIGTCIEDAVKATALGLLHRGKNVRVIVDAVGSQNRKEAKLALRKLIETKDIAGVSSLRHACKFKCRLSQRIKKNTIIIGRRSRELILKGNLKAIQNCLMT
jgi:nicotinamidase-related amidase